MPHNKEERVGIGTQKVNETSSIPLHPHLCKRVHFHLTLTEHKAL